LRRFAAGESLNFKPGSPRELKAEIRAKNLWFADELETIANVSSPNVEERAAC
jgi:hypothetical protein